MEVVSLGSELYRIRLRVMEGFSRWNMSDSCFLLNEQDNGSVTAPMTQVAVGWPVPQLPPPFTGSSFSVVRRFLCS